jgi:hypothetical protein
LLLSLFFPRCSQLIENPWPVGSASELMQHRMAIINLAANIDTRIQKMYEVIECDIAPQVASRAVNVAPYKGKHAQGSGGEAAADIYRQAAAADPGPSTSGRPPRGGGGTLHAHEIIDLTDSPPAPRRRSAAPSPGKGKRKAGA